MSHHVESPEARKDPRVDLCDLYVFEGSEPGAVVLIMTANPQAAKPDMAGFRPGALYEFHVDTDGDAVADVIYRFTFAEPARDAGGRQAVELRRVAPLGGVGTEADLLATGRTEDVLLFAGGGRAWAGVAGDPFFADGAALQTFMKTLAEERRYDPSLFAAGKNFFAAGDVMGIALELPPSAFGVTDAEVAVWITTSVWDHDTLTGINREAMPLLLHAFIVDDHMKLHFNEGAPRDDVARFGDAVSTQVAEVVRLARTADDPDAYGRRVAAMLLPDVQRYRVGAPAGYGAAERNGRRLTDDAMDVMLGILTNSPLTDAVGPDGRARDIFPYLPEPHPAARDGESDGSTS